MRGARVLEGEPGSERTSAWDWLYEDLRRKDRRELRRLAEASRRGRTVETAIVRDWRTGRPVATVEGTETGVDLGAQVAAARKGGAVLAVAHSHPAGDWRQSGLDAGFLAGNRDCVREVVASTAYGRSRMEIAPGLVLTEAQARALRANLAGKGDRLRADLVRTGVLRYVEAVEETL